MLGWLSRAALRLAAKAFESGGIVHQTSGQHLQRDDSVEVGVDHFIDGAHTAGGDVRQHLVFADAGGR